MTRITDHTLIILKLWQTDPWHLRTQRWSVVFNVITLFYVVWTNYYFNAWNRSFPERLLDNRPTLQITYYLSYSKVFTSPCIEVQNMFEMCPFNNIAANHAESVMTSSNGNIFRVTSHLCGEFTGPRWIPRTRASDAELWCFLSFASE